MIFVFAFNPSQTYSVTKLNTLPRSVLTQVSLNDSFCPLPYVRTTFPGIEALPSSLSVQDMTDVAFIGAGGCCIAALLGAGFAIVSLLNVF